MLGLEVEDDAASYPENRTRLQTNKTRTYSPALPNTVIVQCDVLLQYGVTVMTHTVKYGYIAYHVDTGTAVELP